MALPIISVNSATGSDTLASGAGPATALTGSAASTDGTGLIVTLDGSPDLTDVATDGSHVIFVNDSTAGARNFGKITAKDNTAKTVTVANAFGLSISGKAWAIGGKRASIGSTTSEKLFDNNSAAGDAMPGWQVKLESGHSETIAATYDFRRSGDTTDGPIVLCGESGAATLPLLTFSNNGGCLSVRASYIQLQDFELRNSNATKTASVAVQSNSGGLDFTVRRVKCNHSTDKFWKFFLTTIGATQIVACDVGYCASVGIDSTVNIQLSLNYIHHCGSHGISLSGSSAGPRLLYGNLVVSNSGDGLSYTVSSVGAHNTAILHNTFANNTGDGLELNSPASEGMFRGLTLLNNLSTHNGGYGFNFSGATAAGLAGNAMNWLGNQTYQNTSGAKNPSTLPIFADDLNLDPQYVDATNGDYRLGTNLKAAGAPASYLGTYGATRSYVDPGAAQRVEAGSGGPVRRVGGVLAR
jgi:hypothetical protein